MKKTIVVSLGGSLIVPGKIDLKFLRKFRKLVLSYIKKGNRIIITCGGGSICRDYQKAARALNSKATNRDIDWVGIGATKINAELVRTMFADSAFEKIVDNPTKKIITTKKIIVASGYVPGSSSDKDAVLLAKMFKADTVINLSNIKYIYDKDPSKFKDAKPQLNLTYSKLLKITGGEWIPGGHFPFDPVASKLARKFKLNLVVLHGGDLDNLNNFLSNKKFVGTQIS